MNFSIAEVWTRGPLAVLLAGLILLAPLLYLALAWRPARHGSRRGIWRMAGAYLAAVTLLVVVAGLSSPGAFQATIAVATPLLVLGPALLTCAAVLHVGVRADGARPGAGSAVVAALVGYLAMPVGVILAVMLASAMMHGG